MFHIISTCKGGGYHYCRTIPAHPRANKMGLYPMHRVLMENKLGRLLFSTEVVHHKNGNKYDDNIDNLEVLTSSEHSKLHRITAPLVEARCGLCQKVRVYKPNILRQRLKRSKRGKIFCSIVCSAKDQHKSKIAGWCNSSIEGS